MRFCRSTVREEVYAVVQEHCTRGSVCGCAGTPYVRRYMRLCWNTLREEVYAVVQDIERTSRTSS